MIDAKELRMSEEIIEWNKLIAEFMGGILHKKAANNHSFHTSPNGIPIVPDSFLVIGELKYHTSWDWLMPVVEKIEESYHSEIKIESIFCEIEIGNSEGYWQKTIKKDGDSKIEAAWLAVVEFIKWYNQNKNLNYVY